MNMEIGTDVKHTQGYKTMKPNFEYVLSNLNYDAKLPDWSVHGCHGNHIENPASWFCAHCSNTSSTQVWRTYNIQFSSYIRQRVQPIRGLAWLPWQLDQHYTRFLKPCDLSFNLIYSNQGQHRGNIEKNRFQN